MEPSFLGAAALWFVLNVLALWQFQGAWRKAALIPAALMALALGIATLGVLDGSNIAPIWVVFAVPVCLGAILSIWFAKIVVWSWHRFTA